MHPTRHPGRFRLWGNLPYFPELSPAFIFGIAVPGFGLGVIIGSPLTIYGSGIIAYLAAG